MFNQDLVVFLQIKSSRDYNYLGICNEINQVMDERKLFPYLSSLSLVRRPPSYCPSSPCHRPCLHCC